MLDLYAMVVGDTGHVPAYNTHVLYTSKMWLRMFGCWQERKADNKLTRDASLSLLVGYTAGIPQASW